VLSNFLNFTKSSAIAASMVDVNRLLHDVVNFFSPQLKKNKVDVTLSLNDGLPSIKLDGEQLKQVFYNIVINAIQAMAKSGGKLAISTRTEGAKDDESVSNYLCVDFSDSGVGIKQDVIDDLFKPFYTSKDEGTGLGLSISHKIIEKFDGTISVTSEVGNGSTFTVKLPYLKRDEDEEEKDTDNR